jgi:hypothetical protein
MLLEDLVGNGTTPLKPSAGSVSLPVCKPCLVFFCLRCGC